MAEKVITYKVKVVNESGDIIEQTASSFDDLRDSVSSLERELNQTQFGSDKFQQLQKELKNSKGALQEAQQSTMTLGEKFASIPGPIGQVAQSVQGLGTAFKALIMNPVGAVIAAIAAVFIGLYKALTSTEKGTQSLNKVMGALSGLLDPIIKLAQELAQIMIDGVLAAIEAVQGALEFLGFDSFAKASKDAEALAQSINEVEEAEGDLAVERAKQNKELAETREILQDTNKSYDERKKALAQVKKSEEDLAAKETQLAERKLANIREEIRLKGASKELNDQEEAALTALYGKQEQQAATRRKNLKAEQALEREVEAEKKKNYEEAVRRQEEQRKQAEDRAQFLKNINVQIIEDDKQREIAKAKLEAEGRLKEINNLKFTGEQRKQAVAASEEALRQQLADINQKYDDEDKKKKKDKEEQDKADAQKLLEKEKARIDAIIQLETMKDELDLERLKEYLTKKMELELQNSELSEEEKNLIRAKYNAQFVALEKDKQKKLDEIEKQKQEAEQASIDLAISSFDTLTQLAGEETDLGKMLAVISTTISTYDAAQKAYASQMLIATPDAPVRAGIAAGIAIAQGLMRVNKIINTPTDIKKPTINAAYGGVVEGQGSAFMDNVPAMLSSGESVINARSTAMFRPLLSEINAMGGGARFTGGIASNGVDAGQMALLSSIRGSQQKPIQAYVVSSQMTNQAMLDRQQKNRSLI